MNHRSSSYFCILLGVLISFTVSCAPLVCLYSGEPCKKIRLLDETGNPIKSASVGGDPLLPSIMNASNEQGYLVLSKHWANSNTGLVTIKAHGFHEFTQEFDDIEKVVVMKSIND